MMSSQDYTIRLSKKQGNKMENREFVGFGKRTLAYIVDVVIIMTIAFVIAMVFRLVLSFSSEEAVGQMVMTVYFLTYLAYFIIMESSKKQATFGKMLLKIKVINADGGQLTLQNALIRSFSRLLSGLIMGIGYLMVIFMPDKQALHDKLAKTYVVSR